MLEAGSGNVRHRASPHHNRMREYECWVSMRDRCRNPNNKRYEHYGRRGITVCRRWDTFENFLADMGPRPDGHSIDRIDNDGNYDPGNCQWATRSQQRRNRRHLMRNK
jgi:hypothetical protein